MERYLGMDVHASSSTVCVLSATGKRVRQDVLETHGEALVGYLKSQAGRLHLCFEEGEWAHWLYEILLPHVVELVVYRNPGRKGSKSDGHDAYELAERLRTGRLGHPVYKAAGRFTKLRELARAHRLLSRDVVRCKNRLKSSYRRRGIACPASQVYLAGPRKELTAALPGSLHSAVELLGTQLDTLEPLRAQAEEALIQESHRFPISRILETLPGLGPVRVAQLLPIVVTPHRFRSKRQFWSYCGFGVITRSSADWKKLHGSWVKDRVVQTRGLNRNHNKILKAIFKGAATTVIHSRPNRFLEAYERLCEQGTKPNLAKLTVARKLAATALSMWKSQEVYDPNKT